MKNPIDLSVIITVYNIEKYIGECIESVEKQRGINVEIILVNDASSDSSLAICEKYARRNSKISVISNECNKGVAFSRNIGLKAATGEYVYIIDGDDIVVDGALLKIYELCQKNSLDILEFSADVFYEKNVNRECVGENDYIQKYELNRALEGPALFALNQSHYDARWGSACLRCCRREFLINNNLFYPANVFYADGSGFHIYMAAKRAMIVPDIYYMRRVRSESQVTRGAQFYYLESLVILFIEELKIWDKYAFSNEINSGIESYFRRTHRQIIDMYQQFKGKRLEYMLLQKHPAARYYYEHNVANVPLSIDYFSKQEICEFTQKDKVYIYGAGFYADQLAQVFDYIGIDYQYVVTNKKDNPESLRGKRVDCVYDLTFNSDDIVVIAVAPRHQKSISEILASCGITNWKQFIV